MDKRIKIVPFANEHINETINIIAEYHRYHSANFPEHFKNTEADEEREYIKFMLSEEGNYGYVAILDDKVVGLALFGLVLKPNNFVCPEVTYIYEIIVKEEFRSKGIGRVLVNKIVEFSKTRGIEKIELEIKNSNERGISFYKEVGFYDYSKIMFLDI